MSARERIDWVARGREHQWSGRPIPALFCFKRAIAEHPGNGDARFVLGEVLWQLGVFEVAKTAWREATGIASRRPGGASSGLGIFSLRGSTNSMPAG